MTFEKPFAGTFAYQGTITSQSMNNINDAFPSILDKTGDNSDTSPTGGISGRIDVLSGGSIKLKSGAIIDIPSGSGITLAGTIQASAGGSTFNSSSGITFNDSSYLTFNSTGNITIGSSGYLLNGGTLNITSGGTLNINGSANMHVKSSGTVTCDSGGAIELASGGTFNGLSGSFFNLTNTNSIFNNAVISLSGGTTMATSGASYITIASSGTLQTTGGTFHAITGAFTVESAVTSKMGDFPEFITAKSRYVCESPLDGGPGSGTWGYALQFVYSTGSTGGYWVKNLNRTHHGATLSNLYVNFAVGTSHSNEPATFPSLSVHRYIINSMFSGQALSTSDPQYYPTQGSGSAYYDGGTQNYLSYSCNQNNVIDNTSYIYVLTINDEAGANSIVGNAYGTIQMHFTAIPNLSWNI